MSSPIDMNVMSNATRGQFECNIKSHRYECKDKYHKGTT